MFYYFIQILVLLFAIEDLIGKERTKYIERIWLLYSVRLLTAWSYKYKEYHPFLLRILKIISTQVLSVLLMITSLLNISNTDLNITKVFVIILCLISGIFLHYRFIRYLKNTNDIKNYPFELRHYNRLYYYFTEVLPKFAGPPGNLGAAFSLPAAYVVILAASIMYSAIVSIVTINRILLYILSMLLWLLFFGPANILNGIANVTGADSYIKVGKYLVLLILTLMYKMWK